MSNKLRRMARKTAVTGQLAGLLESLSPSLQSMESQLRQVAGMGANLTDLKSNWQEVVQQIQHRVEEVEKQQQQTKAVLLALMYEAVTDKQLHGMSFDEFLTRAKELDESYLSLTESAKGEDDDAAQVG